jgi:RNA polymerase sigma-70 factor (ECF subfamily)
VATVSVPHDMGDRRDGPADSAAQRECGERVWATARARWGGVQGPLVAFLARRFPSRRDAEDVAQEALVRAWRALPSYRDGMRVRTWLFTIAYRLAVSRGRGEVATVSVPHDMGDRRDGPAETAAQRECGERVWATARAHLSEEQVSALWLTYVEELPAGEVARVLGRSWVSVKTMLHRARRKLEPHLAAELYDDVRGAVYARGAR